MDGLGGSPFALGAEYAALLLELLHSLGVAHADDGVASNQRLQLLLSPVLSALRAQGYLDEPEQAHMYKLPAKALKVIRHPGAGGDKMRVAGRNVAVYRVSALESQIWMDMLSGTVVPNSFSTLRGSRTARAR